MRVFVWLLRVGLTGMFFVLGLLAVWMWVLYARTPQVDLEVAHKTELLGAAYKLYGDEKIGLWLVRTLIHNRGPGAIRDVRVRYTMSDYTQPVDHTIDIVLEGQRVVDFYYPIVNEAVTKETSGRSLPVKIEVAYRQPNGRTVTKALDRPIKVMGRNYLTWTSMPDDEIINWYDQFANWPLVGVFMTPNEEVTKSAGAACTSGLNTSSDDEDRIRAWAAIFYCLRNYGVRYIQEPSDAWTPHFNQYVQFPKESIQRKAGTCLDLAVLFASMAQAVGIDAGIALMPGHAIPWIRLQNGNYVFVESTFVDRAYAYGHFPQVVSPRVSFEESVHVAEALIKKNIEQGTLLLADYNELRRLGVVSPW